MVFPKWLVAGAAVARLLRGPSLDSLILFVTSSCNLRCRFCCSVPIQERAHGSDMTLAEFESLAQHAGRLRSVSISGGEPFIRPDIARIIAAFVKNCGVSTVNVPTNGTLTDAIDEQVSILLRENPQLSLTVSVSIDGPSDIHDMLRGVAGTYARATETVQRLSEMKKQFLSLRLKIASLVCPENSSLLRSFLHELSERYPTIDEFGIGLIRRTDTGMAANADRELISAYGSINADMVTMAKAKRTIVYRQSRRMPDLLNRMMQLGGQRLLGAVTENVSKGKKWPFRCVAGRKGVVIAADGTLSACEIRPPVVQLRDYGLDLRAVVSSTVFRDEVEEIRRIRCDCAHGCFMSWSMQSSPCAMLALVPYNFLVDRQWQ